MVFAMMSQVKELVHETFSHFMAMFTGGHLASGILVNFLQTSFECCGSIDKKEYATQDMGLCDAKEIAQNTCQPPQSCCPAGMYSVLYFSGCVHCIFCISPIHTFVNIPALILKTHYVF